MNDDLERRVRKRVRAKKGFLSHLAVYVACIIFFFLINVTTSDPGEDWWFHYPAISWGVGLFFHYIGVFGVPWSNRLSENWEREEMEKELRRRGLDPKDKPMLKAAPKQELDMDQHLQVREIERNSGKDYDEEDLV